jgi:hypothetical protein
MSSLNDGTSADFGAMTHWGAPDIGWNGANARSPVRWKHLVYTYDASTLTQIVYSDGVEANREVLGGPLVMVDSLDGGVTHLPFRVGNETGGDGNPGGFAFSGTIGELRVYTRTLPASEITTSFNSGAAKYGILADIDGLPVWWKRVYGFPIGTNVASLDPDNDGATNADEYHGGVNSTNPLNPDSDGDGLLDGAELTAGTNPNNSDTDLDGLTDAREIGLGTTPGFSGQDSDGDGFGDSIEVLYGSNPTNATSMPDLSTPRPFVNLDATVLPAGPLPVWTNNNALGWSFVAPTGAVANVQVVNGTKGVVFNGTNYYTGLGTPSFMAANASRSVEGWILNPDVAGEETVFAWGRRGGNPDGSNSAFSHGRDAGFGALQFWGGGPDVPWGTNATQIAQNTPAGQWTHVAYTYDNTTGIRACYVNGAYANSETNDVGVVLNTYLYDPSDPLNVGVTPVGRSLPFRVGAQTDAAGAAAGPFATMTIAKLRAYDVALTAQQIANRYNSEISQFPGQPVIRNVRVNTANGFILFDWTPAPGKSYAVETNSSVANAAGWSAAATGVTSGSYSNAISGPQRYYRLRVE